MKLNFKKISEYDSYFVVFFLTTISAFASTYFFVRGQHLLYADAISRLDIARKVVDNLTPGLTQLGNVWLPLPQIILIPFIWNNYFWHSGLAGTITSSIAFIIGGVYIYKSAKLITNSFISSFFALCVYALNINLLYLQSTAMSEALFLCTIAATMYYFLLFFKTKKNFYLIPSAAAVSAMTLTRYEGLAILLSSIPAIYLFSLIVFRKHSKAEANTILYSTLAFLGFGLWTLYLTVIFGNPLYWKEYYATAQATGGGVKAYSQAKPFMAAVWQYTTSSVWMIGLIPMILAILAIPVMLINDLKNRTFYFLPLLMPLSIFLFMVFTLQRNTPIVQPSLTLGNILSSETSFQTGFNIRYGILLLPWVAIITAYLFNFRFFILKLLVFSIFCVQIYTYYKTDYSLIYRIPARIYQKPYSDLVDWMKKHYDGGLIMISASSHEDQMFAMGFDYKTYIHEGTNKYWKESLDDPPRYAHWVILDKGHPQDTIAYKKGIETVLARDYNLVYEKEQVKIYKIKKKPYFEIK